MAMHVTAWCVHDLRAGLNKNADFVFPVWWIYEEKRSSLQQDVCARLEESYTVFYEGLFEQIMTFQQEVMILSRDMPTKAVISPLLPLNGCANFIKKVFPWDEDKNG